MRNVQDLVTDERTPYERRFQESFQGPLIPCGALTEYLRKTPRETKREFFKSGRKVLPGSITRNLSRICFDRGRNLERRHSDCPDNPRIRNVENASEIYPRRLNAKEVLVTHKDGDFVQEPSGRWFTTNCFQEPTLRREFTVRRENLSGKSQDDREEFQPEETKDDEEIQKDFGSIQ